MPGVNFHPFSPQSHAPLRRKSIVIISLHICSSSFFQIFEFFEILFQMPPKREPGAKNMQTAKTGHVFFMIGHVTYCKLLLYYY